MALVCARPDIANEALKRGQTLPPSAGLMGIITLEDVLEQLLQEQILDETDKLERGELRLARWVVARWKLYVSKKRVEREELTKIKLGAENLSCYWLLERFTHHPRYLVECINVQADPSNNQARLVVTET